MKSPGTEMVLLLSFKANRISGVHSRGDDDGGDGDDDNFIEIQIKNHTKLVLNVPKYQHKFYK